MSTGIARDNGMPFGTALALAQRGQRIARRGWNGKGMFLYLAVDAQFLPVGDSEHIATANALPKAPFLVMKTADDKVVPWLASQTDVLANDWCEVE